LMLSSLVKRSTYERTGSRATRDLPPDFAMIIARHLCADKL